MYGTDAFEHIKDQALGQINNFMFASTGYVTSYDRSKPAAKVMLEPIHRETGWLPVSSSYAGSGFGFVADVEQGTECTVVFEHGSIDNGKIVAFHFEDDTPPAINAGEAIFTHKSGSFIRFGADGSINLSAAGGFHIQADVTVAGHINASGDVVGGGISLDGHVHGNVEPGPSNTGGPK